jgi:hypothetical protein
MTAKPSFQKTAVIRKIIFTALIHQLQRVNRRQGLAERRPFLPAILRDPDIASGRPHGQRLPTTINDQRVPVDQVETLSTGQPISLAREGFASITCWRS